MNASERCRHLAATALNELRDLYIEAKCPPEHKPRLLTPVTNAILDAYSQFQSTTDALSLSLIKERSGGHLCSACGAWHRDESRMVHLADCPYQQFLGSPPQRSRWMKLDLAERWVFLGQRNLLPALPEGYTWKGNNPLRIFHKTDLGFLEVQGGAYTPRAGFIMTVEIFHAMEDAATLLHSGTRINTYKKVSDA